MAALSQCVCCVAIWKESKPPKLLCFQQCNDNHNNYSHFCPIWGTAGHFRHPFVWKPITVIDFLIHISWLCACRCRRAALTSQWPHLFCATSVETAGRLVTSLCSNCPVLSSSFIFFFFLSVLLSSSHWHHLFLEERFDLLFLLKGKRLEF